jgi:hypothetical protein
MDLQRGHLIDNYMDKKRIKGHSQIFYKKMKFRQKEISPSQKQMVATENP